MKTIREWLETIEDEHVREKAIKRARPKTLELEMESFRDALSSAFIWNDSDDGHHYWLSIAQKYNT